MTVSVSAHATCKIGVLALPKLALNVKFCSLAKSSQIPVLVAWGTSDKYLTDAQAESWCQVCKCSGMTYYLKLVIEIAIICPKLSWAWSSVHSLILVFVPWVQAASCLLNSIWIGAVSRCHSILRFRCAQADWLHMQDTGKIYTAIQGQAGYMPQVDYAESTYGTIKQWVQ